MSFFKMRNKKTTVIFFLVLAACGFLLTHFYLQNPITFFVLKNTGNQIQAFEIQINFNRTLGTFEAVPLNDSQELEGRQILAGQNPTELKRFSKTWGAFDFVEGLPQPQNQDISRVELLSLSENGFGDMTRLDSAYLSMEFHITQIRPLSCPPVPPETNGAPSVTETKPTAVVTPVSDVNVRVEILNGCGIKGAADWVVARLKAQGISAKNGGNADNFLYKTSRLRLKFNPSPVFKKALTQSGMSNIDITQTTLLPEGYDAVLIIGKDFKRVKGH